MIQLRQAPLVVAMSACLLATLALPGYAAAQEQGSRPHRTAREARDARDANRAAAPLTMAQDAVLLETSDLAIDAAVQRAIALAEAQVSEARRNRRTPPRS